MGHSTSTDQMAPARPSRILMKICINVTHGLKLTSLKYFDPTPYTSWDIAW